MKEYPRTPSRGGPMTAKIESVRQGEAALAHAPSRDAWLAKWGLTSADAKAMRLGLHNQCLAIPFFAADGTLQGIKLRTLGSSHADGNRRYFWQSPGNAPPLYLPPEGLDGGPVLLAEGSFKARAVTIILGRPACALASGVRVGLPRDALHHFQGKDVWSLCDPDDEGMAGSEILARQLRGVAKSLKAIPFPPCGWTYKGEKADDLNDVLRLLRAHHPGIEVAFPGIAAWILRELEKAPELLNGRPEPRTTGPAIHPEFQDLTQLWAAGRFVSDHRDDVLWCQRQRIWYLWTGKGWRADDVIDVQIKAKDTIVHLIRDAVEIKDHKGQAAYLHFAMRLQKRSEVDAMVDLAKSYLPARVSDFDQDPWLLNCVNGTLELRTGALRDHRREDMITKFAPVAYDPDARCDLFLAFLDRIMAEDRDVIRFLQKILGYALTGDVREDLFFIFWGRGANGKTTLLRLLLWLLGDYAKVAAADLFIVKKHETHATDYADLWGARFVMVLETGEGQRLNTGKIKVHTGRDPVKARFLYQDNFTFDPTYKVLFCTNHRPIVRETGTAMWRRLVLLPFVVEIPKAEQDKELGEKLKAEAPGILRWLVEGCLLWQREGLESPEAVKTATETYRIESDPLGRFLEERCVLSDHVSVKRSELYAAFTDWESRAGEKSWMTSDRFGERLREKGIASGATQGVRMWRGVALTPQE